MSSPVSVSSSWSAGGHGPTSQVGFILVTGRGDPALIEKGRAFRMNNYLEKPIDGPKMKACIEAIVGKLD
jgi:two-component system chemotaxis response regulator CheY